MSAISLTSKFMAYSGLVPTKAASRDAAPLVCPAAAGCNFFTIFIVTLEPVGLRDEPDKRPSNLSPDLTVTTTFNPYQKWSVIAALGGRKGLEITRAAPKRNINLSCACLSVIPVSFCASDFILLMFLG